MKSSFHLQPLSFDGVMRDFKAIRENPGSMLGVPTGYNDLDYITNGLPKGELVVLAARPSVGKSALALNIAYNAGLSGYVTALFSQEMSADMLVWRLASMASGISASAIRQGYYKKEGRIVELTDAHYQRFEAGLLEVNSLPILACPGRISTQEMRDALYTSLDDGSVIDIVMDDFIQLHTDSGGVADNNALTVVSNNLQGMARDAGIPLIAISQMSREIEKRGGDYEPQLSDLRGSGALEQAADQVWFIKRSDYYAPAGEVHQPRKGSKCEVIISKNRNGELGRVDLFFQKTTTRFLAWGEVE